MFTALFNLVCSEMQVAGRSFTSASDEERPPAPTRPNLKQ
jgi:hypothetical protein